MELKVAQEQQRRRRTTTKKHELIIVKITNYLKQENYKMVQVAGKEGSHPARKQSHPGHDGRRK